MAVLTTSPGIPESSLKMLACTEPVEPVTGFHWIPITLLKIVIFPGNSILFLPALRVARRRGAGNARIGLKDYGLRGRGKRLKGD